MWLMVSIFSFANNVGVPPKVVIFNDKLQEVHQFGEAPRNKIVHACFHTNFYRYLVNRAN